MTAPKFSPFLTELDNLLRKYPHISGTEKHSAIQSIKSCQQTGYVYAIYCTVNSRAYVGQALHFDQRVRQHIEQLEGRKYCQKSSVFLLDWNMYGIDKFVAEVLEEPAQAFLLRQERNWQESLNAVYSHKEAYKIRPKHGEEEWVCLNGKLFGVELMEEIKNFTIKIGHEDAPLSKKGIPLKEFLP